MALRMYPGRIAGYVSSSRTPLPKPAPWLAHVQHPLHGEVVEKASPLPLPSSP